MKANIGAEIISQALVTPVQTWLDYGPGNTPMVVYDEDDFIFINHPHPPSARPAQLTAATAIDINGILTATVPASWCADEQSLVPLAYHECFHVYQGEAFQFDQGYDFFAVLAYYPELNYVYRALCAAETAVISHKQFSVVEQARYLSALTRKRHQILSQHDGLLDFEKDLERNEGVASFVEQKAREQLYGVSPDNTKCHYGYSRQYFMGAAICRLLEGLSPTDEWQVSIQEGVSLTEYLSQMIDEEKVDLTPLGLSELEEQEQVAAKAAWVKANEQLQDLVRTGTIALHLPDNTQVFRSFSPKSLVSLGDGRLLHPEFVIIELPHGKIAIQGEMTLEDHAQKTVVFRRVPYEVIDHTLRINTENIEVSINNVRQVSDGIFEVIER